MSGRKLDRMKTSASADIVGTIGLTPDIREAPAFEAPTRVIEVFDCAGRLHGRIDWLDSDITPDFVRELKRFSNLVMR